MNIRTRLFSSIAIASALLACSLTAAPVTNESILKMVAADLSADLIIASIRGSSERAFDTSPDALVALKKANVPDAVLAEMLAPGKAAPATAAAATAATSDSSAGASEQIAEDSLIALDGGKEVQLSYTTAEVRTAVRGLGFGGAAIYNVLRGPRAEYRMKDRSPAFLVAIPKNAQPSGFLQVASFAVRPNHNREVMVGGGVYSVSLGIHEDRVMPITTEKLADQSRAKHGFVVYKVSMARPLAPGEYAVVVLPSAQKGMGPTGPIGFSCYDFGID